MLVIWLASATVRVSSVPAKVEAGVRFVPLVVLKPAAFVVAETLALPRVISVLLPESATDEMVSEEDRSVLVVIVTSGEPKSVASVSICTLLPLNRTFAVVNPVTPVSNMVSPDARSVMVSPFRSLTEPVNWSVSAPPVRLSVPAPPPSVSAPAPPSIVSPPALPVMPCAPAEPVTTKWSAPVSVAVSVLPEAAEAVSVIVSAPPLAVAMVSTAPRLLLLRVPVLVRVIVLVPSALIVPVKPFS